MPVAESEFLRAFRDSFEQGNRAWNAGDVQTDLARGAGTAEPDEVIEFFESFQETFPVRAPGRTSTWRALT